MKKNKTKVETVDLGKAKFKVHKGALHRALGVPESEDIGKARIKKAEKSSNPEIRKMADSAAGLASMAKQK